MSAKEMFEKLGYKQIQNNKNYIEYEKNIEFCHIKYTIYVQFDFFGKYAFVNKDYKEPAPIYYEELKAIKKQIEELR